ncbi:sulfatase-like hydrolase/transferase [Neorhodopirellula pilleata]|uniref:Arylsulfatase n=1 Tax=Neorhodopirellula pilleata TaxID=2714738 RepID=A0A5C5ZXX7_9BACT|nr:sulfatase-like hydrolase/transferase [Neorhodopirellula pilleata]TWT91858.1 Arylsulfatase [Neorhodopirellula pilleata]
MSSRTLFKCRLCCLTFLCFGLLAGQSNLIDAADIVRPNILLIVSDDQGYNDVGILGNGIITPTLDQLAHEGTRLTDFYVAWPACTPSRGSILTGRYPQRNGIYDMIRNEAPDYGHKYPSAEYEVTFERIGGMDVRERIVAELLQHVGYQTAIYGKWDLGSLKRFLPTSRGFDDFYGFVNTGIDYYTHERYGVPSMYRGDQRTEQDRGTYCTKLFEREAIRFLQNRDRDRPFFLYVPFNAPHNSSSLDPAKRSTVQAPDSYKAMYPSVENEDREASASHKYAKATARVATPEARQRDYRASVTCMDEAIGEIIRVLQQQSCYDNTIVIFFSDNGGSGGSDNTPLRGKKGQMWEGGIRVPMIIRWPSGGIPPGRVNDSFLTSLELVPSLLAATKTSTPDDLILDGFDWWDCLRGAGESPRDQMFWQRRDHKAARVGDWKWVDMGTAGGGLFDLSIDIGETNDLSQQHPDKRQELEASFETWRQSMQAVEPRGPFRDF